jgi:hypothetical protein
VKSKILQRLSLWLPPVLWALLIFRLSSGTVPVASTVFWQDFAVKKTGHFLLFGVLAIFVYRALIGEGFSRKTSAVWSVVFATFYGATDEFHQSFTMGREATVRDVFFDGLGASVFIFLTYNFLQKLPNKVKSVLREIDIV